MFPISLYTYIELKHISVGAFSVLSQQIGRSIRAMNFECTTFLRSRSLSHKHRKKPICTIPMYILYFIILYVCFVREHLYIRRKKSMNSAQKHLAFFSLPASRSSLRSSMAAAAVKRMNESEAKKKRIGTPETHKNIYCMRGLQIFLLCRSRLYKNRFLIKNNSSDFYQYREHIKITETNQRSPTKMWMSKNETKHTLLSVRSRTQIRNKQILDNIYK